MWKFKIFLIEGVMICQKKIQKMKKKAEILVFCGIVTEFMKKMMKY